ncbi:MAG TPA: hypothetical protein VLN58_02085 [Verrucomicrobiae bacterium]|nr:hypothetical protein [Verrucomicrobiae bacterium]
MHRKWRNGSTSFQGKPLTKLESARVAQLAQGADIPLDAKLAILLDEPDYVVISFGVPVLWHATTSTDDRAWKFVYEREDFKEKAKSGYWAQMRLLSLLHASLNGMESASNDDCGV